MAIGSDVSNSVLNEFISGTENSVFTAQDSSQIQDFFKFVTMSVTTRTNSQMPNVVPSASEVKQLVEDRVEKAQSNSESVTSLSQTQSSSVKPVASPVEQEKEEEPEDEFY